MTVLQIESRRAVEAREEILPAPGIDAVLVGPAGLWEKASEIAREIL